MSSLYRIWLVLTSGRLGIGWQHSNSLTYNTFPFPQPDPDQAHRIEQAAQRVLDTRASHNTHLAALYDPLAMPVDLRAAHAELDRAVEAAYRDEPFRDDSERLAHLLALYQELAGG